MFLWWASRRHVPTQMMFFFTQTHLSDFNWCNCTSRSVALRCNTSSVPATSSVMYVIRAMQDVVSRWLEVDVGRPLVEVGRKCPLLACSRRLMRCRVMSPGTDVALHEAIIKNHGGQARGKTTIFPLFFDPKSAHVWRPFLPFLASPAEWVWGAVNRVRSHWNQQFRFHARTEAQKVLIGGILKCFSMVHPLDLEKPLFGPFQNRVFKPSRRQAPSAGFHNLGVQAPSLFSCNEMGLFRQFSGNFQAVSSNFQAI